MNECVKHHRPIIYSYGTVSFCKFCLDDRFNQMIRDEVMRTGILLKHKLRTQMKRKSQEELRKIACSMVLPKYIPEKKR